MGEASAKFSSSRWFASLGSPTRAGSVVERFDGETLIDIGRGRNSERLTRSLVALFLRGMPFSISASSRAKELIPIHFGKARRPMENG